MKVLGFDLGTNSVGSAMVEFDKEGQLLEILHAGSRILPMGQEKTEFEQGQTITKNQGRRLKRSIRRTNQRFKMRRNNLLKAFEALGWFDLTGWQEHRKSGGTESFDRWMLGSDLTDAQVYGLRAKAISEAVTIKEFARILFHLNQRRGYKPTRGDRGRKSKPENESTKIDYLIATIVAVEPTGEYKAKRRELKITLSTGQTALSTDNTFNAMVGKQAELKIITRKSAKESPHSEISIPDSAAWAEKLHAMTHAIENSGESPGQYFYNQIVAAQGTNEDYRVRQRLVLRKFYESEFDRIWEMQSQYHPQLSDPIALSKTVDAVLPQNSTDKAAWKKKNLYHFIRDYIIYYQRKLKSQKKNIGNCPYESPNPEQPKKVIPASHPLFQEFRIWQGINNLKIELNDGTTRFLSTEEKELIFHTLSRSAELTKDKIAKLLKANQDSVRMAEDLPGHETRYEIAKECKRLKIAQPDLSDGSPEFEKLWHTLYSLEEAEDVSNALQKQFFLEKIVADELAEIVFKKEYGSLSAKALKKLLPMMRAGQYFNSNRVSPKAAEIISKLLNGEAILGGNGEEENRQALRDFFESEKIMSFSGGLPYWVAASILYGKHTAKAEGDPYTDPSQIKPLPLHSLRNPVVEQVVNETLQVAKAIWIKHGKPDEIRIELPREMKQNAKERKQAYSEMLKRKKERQAVETILKAEFHIPNPSRKDIDKYLLWKEGKEHCPYTGKQIPKTALFNGEVDVDHIIPRQRFFDDSFHNKVLCYRSANEEKRNETAFEYMSRKDWARYEEHVKTNFTGRRKFLLLTPEIPTGFLERQLVETRFIARKVKQLLERMCPGKVWVSTGTVTDYLKGEWGLNEVFKQVLKPRFERLEKLSGKTLISEKKVGNQIHLQLAGFEKRIDHRHHSLDAITVAVTKQAYIQQLNSLNEKYLNNPGSGMRKFPLPHPRFREMVREQLETMIVTHKVKPSLVSFAVNHYWKRNEQGRLEKVAQSEGITQVRGQLHDESVYGKVKRYETVEIVKILETPEQLIVPWQREAVEKRIAKFSGDLNALKKDLKKNPIPDLKGEELKKATVFSHQFTKSEELHKITLTKLMQVADLKLRRELLAYIAPEGEKLETSISQEGINTFNASRKKPVYKVRYLPNESPVSLTSDDNGKFVLLENNYSITVYQFPDGSRKFEPLKFFDAVKLRMAGLPLWEAIPNTTVFTLKAGELVYLPLPDESPATIDWENTVQITSRLFKFTKGGEKQLYFLPHQTAITFQKKINLEIPIDEYGSQNALEFWDGDDPRTKISQTCIKIKTDRLGKIMPH
jgi:CRISPR-associated endonuclease Csn1